MSCSYDLNFRSLQPIKGKNGVTFTPYIEEGWLKWTNDGGLPNPEPFYIGGGGGDIPAMTIEEAIAGVNTEPKIISAHVLHSALDNTIEDVIERSY